MNGKMFYHSRRNVFSSIILFMCCRIIGKLHVSLLARIYLFPCKLKWCHDKYQGGGRKSISVPNCIKIVQLGCVAHYVVYIPIRNPSWGGFRQGAWRLRCWNRIFIEYLPASAFTECWFRDFCLFSHARQFLGKLQLQECVQFTLNV